MNEMGFENKLRSIANRMKYPRTPNIVGSVTTRLRTSTRSRFNSKALAWSLTIILVLCSSLMFIPPARAAILEFIQIGVVRILRGAPTVEIAQTATPNTMTPLASTSTPPVSDLIPILKQMAGETTLARAQQLVDYSILLPAYPAGLGKPDHVFVQDADGAMTILIWVDPQHADRILLSLHFIPAGSWAVEKGVPANILETGFNGHGAIWGEGPYPLRMENGDVQFTRLIEGYVLIWTDKNITYRLETDMSLTEAIKIAESLQPISAP